MMDLIPQTVDGLQWAITGWAMVFLGMITLNAFSRTVIGFFISEE